MNNEGIVQFCPLHNAAAELLEALKTAKWWVQQYKFQMSHFTVVEEVDAAIKIINEAISKAENNS